MAAALTLPGNELPSEWRQWYASYSISGLRQALGQLAENLRGGGGDGAAAPPPPAASSPPPPNANPTSPNTTGPSTSPIAGATNTGPQNTTTSTTTLTTTLTTTSKLSLTIRRAGLLVHKDLLSGTWRNVDGSAMDMSASGGSPRGSLPAGFNPAFVRSQAWAPLAAGQLMVYGGGKDDDTAGSIWATSRRLTLVWSVPEARMLENSTLRHEFFESGSSTVVMRSMHTIALQNLGSSNGTGYSGSTSGLFFFGKVDTSDAAAPSLGTAIVSNVSSFSMVASCSPDPSSSCSPASPWGGGKLPQRDEFASAPLLASFNGSSHGSTESFEIRAPLVLVYGGLAAPGGRPPKRDEVPSGSADSVSQLKSVLTTCDTKGMLSSVEWSTVASCAWTGMSSIMSSCSSSSSGGGGNNGPGSHRRRGLRVQQETRGRGRGLQGQVQEGAWRTEAVQGAGDQAFGWRWAAAAGGNGGGGARSRSAAESATGPTYYGSALALVLQDPAARPLTLLSTASRSATLLHADVSNLQGGDQHSPGPRLGASMAAVSERGTLLFGGASYDSAAALADGSIDDKDLFLTSDLHYLRLYVGGDDVLAEPDGIQACAAAAGGAGCASAANVTFTPQQPLPTKAPVLYPSDPDLPTAASSFACTGNTTVRVDVVGSMDPNWAAGFRITTWSGQVLLEKEELTSAMAGTKLGATALPPGTAIPYGTVTLPPGLIQVWLYSKLGKGWTMDPDNGPATATCCVRSGAAGSLNTSCCPQLRLFSPACNGYLDGFGVGEAIFDVGTDNRNNMSFFQYRRVLGIVVQPTTAQVPTGEAALYLQYPLGQRGLHLHTFEVQPARGSPIPAPRHRHASAFVNHSSLHSYYGNKGVLVLYGGSSSYTISGTSGSSRLSDLWLLCLSNNTWIRVQPGGAMQPPALIGHAMAAVYIAGGEYYNPASGTFQQDSSVYMLDLGMPSPLWRKLAGGSNIFNTTAPSTGYYSLAYLPELNQLAFSTPKGRFDSSSSSSSGRRLYDMYDGRVPHGGSGAAVFRVTHSEDGRLGLVREDARSGSGVRAGVPIRQTASAGSRARRRLAASALSISRVASSVASGGLSSAELLAQYTADWPLTVVDCNGSGTALTISVGGSTVQNFLFKNCADTALLVSASSSEIVEINNCVFYNNMGTRGGAVRVSSGSNVSLSNCLFLANDAALGGAVYVDGGATLHSLSGAAFVRNGNGNSNAGGGALYADAGSCLPSLEDCAFDGNGNENTTLNGGAAFLTLPACDVALRGSSFAANTAASGGALAISGLDSTLGVSISASDFVSNRASATGGALAIQASFGRVQLDGCRFVANAAGRRGGAIMTSSARSTNATGCIFTGNTATLGAGGAWSAEKEGDIRVERCAVLDNAALYGGGLSLSRDLTLALLDSSLHGNTARYAGALEAQDCNSVSLTRCSFANNSAASAGAIAVSQTSSGVRISDCNFTANAASTGASSSEPCGRYGGGGGGAACLDVAGDIVVSGGSFVSNAATNGGAIWASQKCTPSSDGACGHVQLYGTSVHGNRAVGGGGGAVFLYELDDMLISCAYDGSDARPASALSSDNASGGDEICSGAWYNNIALYGNLMASTAASMRVLVPAGSSLLQYRSNDALVVTVDVVDAFGQRIAGGSPEAATTFTAVAVTAQPLGSLSQSATSGVANFSSLRVRNKPGNYTFDIIASGTFHSLQPAVVGLEVRRCQVGEVTTSANDMCTPCTAGSFSFNPDNTTCDSCPPHATCAPNGTQGYVVLPNEGYWRSGPYSPQVMECPNPGACSYDGSSHVISLTGAPMSRQSALMSVLLEMNGGLSAAANGTARLLNSSGADPVALFRELQCSEGYYGNVCGGCVRGYGRTGDARALNSLYYALLSLVNVAIIAVTIRAQLVRSSEKDPLPQLKAAPGEAAVADNGGDGDGEREGKTDLKTGPGKAYAKPEPEPSAGAGAKGAGGKRGGGDTVYGRLSPRVNGVTGKGGVGEADASGAPTPRAAVVQSSKGGNEMEMTDEELVTGTHSIVIKILVSYLQVAAIVEGVALVWPSPVKWFLNLGDQLSSGIAVMVSLDCSLPDSGVPKAVGRVLVSVFVPFILMALSVPVWAVVMKVRSDSRVLRGKPAWDAATYLPPRLIMTAITIVFFAYPSVTEALLGIFSCPQLDQAGASYFAELEAVGRFWAEDYNMKCYTGAHRTLTLALGVPGVILFSCGVPAWIAWFLGRNQDKLRDRKFYRAYGFLYSDYEDRCFAWESAIMLRKLAFVAVVVFLGPVSLQVQLLVLLGIILAALAAQTLYDPYRCPRMDALERISLYGTTTIVYTALFFMLDLGRSVDLVLTVLLVGLNSAIMCWFVLMLLREVARGVMRGLDEDKDGLVSAVDVQRALDNLHRRHPWLAARLLHLDAWARHNAITGRVLSTAYPYGEFSSPWIAAALEEEREVLEDLQEQEQERLAELAEKAAVEHEEEKIRGGDGEEKEGSDGQTSRGIGQAGPNAERVAGSDVGGDDSRPSSSRSFGRSKVAPEPALMGGGADDSIAGVRAR
ncbi:hypothetical protein GPECTOR_97g746 [Gonium pectorale]|uniref:EF-hand domain-containing protein n=1 Tax=Gonium pectorale TaxID=33097 RepID=A0A150G053_GONPE|nr:hypothetical protein GPECTOR_97g746 [Gonium pectorale]|eukprot:KXZ43208.1 hypothetical protein GPECTOR_97g746 [Gonium pectorale]